LTVTTALAALAFLAATERAPLAACQPQPVPRLQLAQLDDPDLDDEGEEPGLREDGEEDEEAPLPPGLEPPSGPSAHPQYRYPELEPDDPEEREEPAPEKPAPAPGKKAPARPGTPPAPAEPAAAGKPLPPD
jgi:hypothetical protein